MRCTEKCIARFFKQGKSFIVAAIENLFLEKLPVAFNQVQVGRIRWQKDQFDVGVTEVLFYDLRSIITGVIANDVNLLSRRILRFDLLKQLDSRLRIDGLVVAND